MSEVQNSSVTYFNGCSFRVVEKPNTPPLSFLILTNTSSREGQLLSAVPRGKARAQSCGTGLPLTAGPA